MYSVRSTPYWLFYYLREVIPTVHYCTSTYSTEYSVMQGEFLHEKMVAERTKRCKANSSKRMATNAKCGSDREQWRFNWVPAFILRFSRRVIQGVVLLASCQKIFPQLRLAEVVRSDDDEQDRVSSTTLFISTYEYIFSVLLHPVYWFICH